MSKAEQRALEAYPPKYAKQKRNSKMVRSEKADTHSSARAIYIKGYNQSEKDSELTWEDIDWIVGEAVCRVSEDSVAEQICKEVLKRFKERKQQ